MFFPEMIGYGNCWFSDVLYNPLSTICKPLLTLFYVSILKTEHPLYFA